MAEHTSPQSFEESMRSRAERAERRLAMALELTQMIIWELDEQTHEVRWWGDEKALFARPVTYEVIISDDLGLVFPDDRAHVAACWAEHENNGVARCEYRVNRPDGTLVWVASSRETVFDAEGRRTGLIGVLRDITHKKVSEAALDVALGEAKAANLAKSEFLANMSHEIRTPLNGVLGIAGALALSDLTLDQREMVEIIESSGKTLQALLSDVLDLSRIESGRFEIMIDVIDLAVLVGQVGALFREAATRKNIALELAIDPALTGAWLGDATRIRQILSNLVSNAVKFTEAGRVVVHVKLVNGDVIFEVTDTGIGFDNAFRERLFGRFTQADSSITRRFGGSGLGLSISNALAQLMGGRLEAESEPTGGAVFRLCLPLCRDMSSPITEIVAVGTTLSPGQNRKGLVLLAEDHPTNRRLVEIILQRLPVELITVENGADAVNTAFTRPFDLILMDMQMPILDGLAATRAIRARELEIGHRRTPICMLTANVMAEHVRVSHEVGADRHLGKPLSATALLNLVEEFIPIADVLQK